MGRRSDDEISPNGRHDDAAGAANSDAKSDRLRFGGFEFDERRLELRHDGGRIVALRPRVDTLLRVFLHQPGRLISRDELIGSIWPSTVVTDDSLVQCVGELRTALGDTEQRFIRTVRGRGYRWEMPVQRVVRDAREVGPRVRSATPPVRPFFQQQVGIMGRRTHLVLFVAGSALLLIAMSSRLVSPRVNIDAEMMDLATVAVLPFATADASPETRALADLVANAVTSQFATRMGMRGIGPPATAAYASSPLEGIAKRSKAQLVLHGQVARSGNDLKVDVQLITTADGSTIWSRQANMSADSATARSELGQKVVNAVRNRGSRSPEPPDERWLAELSPAVAQTVLGAWELDHHRTLADVRQARGRFEDALRSDPRSIIARNGLSISYAAEWSDPEGSLTPEQFAIYEKSVNEMATAAPHDATALLLWGTLQLQRGHPELAIPAIEKSIGIVPSYPNAYVLLARAQLASGRAAEVGALANHAIERGEGDAARVSRAYLVAAEASLMLEDEREAVVLLERSIAAQPSNFDAHAVLAAIDVLQGRHQRAIEEMAELAGFGRRRRSRTTSEGFRTWRRAFQLSARNFTALCVPPVFRPDRRAKAGNQPSVPATTQPRIRLCGLENHTSLTAVEINDRIGADRPAVAVRSRRA